MVNEEEDNEISSFRLFGECFDLDTAISISDFLDLSSVIMGGISG